MCYVTTNQQFDGTPLIVGILTILKQFHPQYTNELLQLLCQFIKCHIHDQTEKMNDDKGKNKMIPKQAKNALHFLDLACKYGAHIDRKDVAQYLPSYMMDSYDASSKLKGSK